VVLVGAGRRPRRVRRGGGAGPVAPTRAASLQDPRQGAGPNGNGHGNGARGHRRAPSRPRRRPG
jgi:hypothetical protein